MNTEGQVDRVRAVLMDLRDQLVEHQHRQPHPRTLVPADFADFFNETLAGLEAAYGRAWVTSLSMNRWSIVPASTRKGGYPAIASVHRDTLLSKVRTALRRLSTDAPLPQDSTTPATNHELTPGTTASAVS
jgi:hypothetical protein